MGDRGWLSASRAGAECQLSFESGPNTFGYLPLTSHIFDRFHRGTNVDDRRFGGMGLGLYICRAIVIRQLSLSDVALSMFLTLVRAL